MSDIQGIKGAKKQSKRGQVMDRLKENGLRFWVNSLNCPTVHIPNDPYQKDWPADDQRIVDILHSAYYDLHDEIMPAAEKEFLRSQIREECRLGGRIFGETEAEKVEINPIVQAVLFLMNQVEYVYEMTASIRQRLSDIHLNNGIDSAKEIPAFTSTFSQRLRRLIPVLNGFGVFVSIDHKEEGSFCTLKRLESFKKEPEPIKAKRQTDDSHRQPSGNNSNSTRANEQNDDSDGEIQHDDPAAKKALQERLNKMADSEPKGGAQ